MKSKKTEIIKIITDYLDHRITRDDLYQLSKDIENRLIKESFLYFENLSISPFIRSLTIPNYGGESINDDEIKNILDILNGKKAYTETKIIRNQPGFNSYSIDELFDKLKEYETNDYKFKDDDIQNISDNFDLNSVHSIPDLLYSHIISLLSILPFKKGLDFNCGTFYCDTEDLIIEEYVNKIKKLIQYYKGDKEFIISLLYQNGFCNITILT